MIARRVCSNPVICIKSKGAILMIWVSMALYIYLSHVSNINIYIAIEINSVLYFRYDLFLYLTLTLYIFNPLFGWIADAWIGRYKAILYGLYSFVIGCVFLTASVIINDFKSSVSHIFLYTSSTFNSLGIAAVYANMLPFITDQMIGASSNELSAAVHWWYWSQIFPNMLQKNEPCILNNTPQIIASIVISISGLAIALSSLFLGQHWLDKTPQITSPIKHIAKVLNYARKNKYPRNRSALTYWEQDVPSRLDLGKDKYGGPFSEEEVENVKTALRLIPIIFICAMQGLTLYVTSVQQRHMTTNYDKILACFFIDEINLVDYSVGIGIPLYHFIIRPFLPKITKYIPSMLTIIGAAIFIRMLGTIGMATIETVGHLKTPNVSCMFNDNIEVVMSLNYYWTIIPQVFGGFGIVLCTIGSFEFIIAQSPLQMKGFLFGLWFAFNGMAKLIGYNLYRLFLLLPQSIPVSCGFYYYLTQTLLLLLLFVGFCILSKLYKLRVRNNPVNIHMIVETHITAYIDQEEEYFKEIDDEIYSSINSLSHSSFGATYN